MRSNARMPPGLCASITRARLQPRRCTRATQQSPGIPWDRGPDEAPRRTRSFDHLAWCEQRLDDLGHKPERPEPALVRRLHSPLERQAACWGTSGASDSLRRQRRKFVSTWIGHLDRLPDEDERSRAIVSRMRDEEKQHGEDAVDAGAADSAAAA